MKCHTCKGDGIARCDNPDHGFIEMMPGEINRLGCPACGYDHLHRLFKEQCVDCKGTGEVNVMAYMQRRIDYETKRDNRDN